MEAIVRLSATVATRRRRNMDHHLLEVALHTKDDRLCHVYFRVRDQAFSATTLPCPVRLPDRNFLMLRAACRMRCSFSTSARRTYWSPYSPKPTPGATATPVSWISSFANSSEPRCAYWSGIGDHTNIVAFGEGRF